MALEKTKIILERLKKKYAPEIMYMRQDVKPTYQSGPNLTGTGYSYDPLDPSETDVIYNALGEIQSIFNDGTGPIHFDLGHYITEKKAVEELKFVTNFLEERKQGIESIKEKYASDKPTIYPIAIVLNLYTEVVDVLRNEILNSDEFREFDQPGTIDGLTAKNDELAFQLYWNKRKWSYASHAIAFLFFLAGAILAIVKKNEEGLPDYLTAGITIFLGILTILFNLFFGFHNTFKESYRLILPVTRRKLREQEKEKFLKAKK